MVNYFNFVNIMMNHVPELKYNEYILVYIFFLFKLKISLQALLFEVKLVSERKNFENVMRL